MLLGLIISTALPAMFYIVLGNIFRGLNSIPSTSLTEFLIVFGVFDLILMMSTHEVHPFVHPDISISVFDQVAFAFWMGTTVVWCLLVFKADALLFKYHVEKLATPARRGVRARSERPQSSPVLTFWIAVISVVAVAVGHVAWVVHWFYPGV